jgi:protein SCO1/2
MPLCRVSRTTLFVVIALGLLLSAGTRALSDSPAFQDIGIEQKLGATIPLDAIFTGEEGERVSLRQLVTAPTILALVYYQCPNVCDYLLTGIAGVLGPLEAEPGTDYNVVTISIDPKETPADARQSRRRSLQSIQKPFPPASWRFLTGEEAQINAVAQATGFHYARSANGFDHPVALIILSPSGKIVRYMNGADFLPADLKLSLMEAQAGRIGPTIAKLVRICFRVDPKSHTLVFMTTRVVASITLLFAAGLALAGVLLGRRRRRRLNGP